MSFLSNKKKVPAITPEEAARLKPSDILKISQAVKLGNAFKEDGYHIDELFISPIHSGVAKGFLAQVTDEEWASSAAQVTKKVGLVRYFIRMLALLRSDLKGRPYKPMPAASDPCSCKSYKKYSECCGYGIEDGDPEECKRGSHHFTPWNETAQGRLVRGCWNCTLFEEAPWATRTELDGLKVLLVGCKYCGAIPTLEDVKATLKEVEQYDLCGYCGKAIGFKSICLQHKYWNGEHGGSWTITEAEWNPLVDFSSDTLADKTISSKSASVHLECLDKAFPFWPKITTSKYTEARQSQHAFHKERGHYKKEV